MVEFAKNRPNTWSVIGNHEYFSMTDYIETDALLGIDSGVRRWRDNSLAAFSSLRGDLGEYREWILSLPPVIESDEWILVHGGLHPNYGVDTPVEIATLLRYLDDDLPWYEHYYGEKTVIYGHWAVDGLRIRPNTIGLDTGCCF